MPAPQEASVKVEGLVQPTVGAGEPLKDLKQRSKLLGFLFGVKNAVCCVKGAFQHQNVSYKKTY